MGTGTSRTRAELSYHFLQRQGRQERQRKFVQVRQERRILQQQQF